VADSIPPEAGASTKDSRAQSILDAPQRPRKPTGLTPLKAKKPKSASEGKKK